MRRLRSFNHSTCKTVLNLLEAVYLRLKKIVVERVTVVKFGDTGSVTDRQMDRQKDRLTWCVGW